MKEVFRMQLDEMRSQMEIDLLWRQEEIAFFKNQLCNINNEEEKNKYRKSLVLILYSHYEGFMKICLLTYVQYLNTQNLMNKDAVVALKASSINDAFKKFENTNTHFFLKEKDGKSDGEMDRFYRRVQLVNALSSIDEKQLQIDDTVINTESNLWYVVLQKNLYRIGMPTSLFDDLKRDIDSLVNRRNSIAHGTQDSGVTEKELTRWENVVKRILEESIKILFKYAKDKNYLNDRVPKNDIEQTM